MDLGSLELQIFVSLTVVLGAAFVALVCDYLKGNNEQLREHNIELRVRKEEQERRALLDPAGFIGQWIPGKSPERRRSGAAGNRGRAARRPAAPHEMMQSFAGADALQEAEARASRMQVRAGDAEYEAAEVPPMAEPRAVRGRASAGRPRSAGWVSPEAMARVAGHHAKQEAGETAESVGKSEVREPEAPVSAAAPEPRRMTPAAEKLQQEIERVAKLEQPVPTAPPGTILRPLTVPSLQLDAEIQRVAAQSADVVESLSAWSSPLLDEVIAASGTKAAPVAVAEEVETVAEAPAAPEPTPVAVAEEETLAAAPEPAPEPEPLLPELAGTIDDQYAVTPHDSGSAGTGIVRGISHLTVMPDIQKPAARLAAVAPPAPAVSEEFARDEFVGEEALPELVPLPLETDWASGPVPEAPPEEEAIPLWRDTSFLKAAPVPVAGVSGPIDISAARAPEPPPAPAAPATPSVPDLLLPAGMHDAGTWARLLTLPNPLTGILFIITMQPGAGAAPAGKPGAATASGPSPDQLVEKLMASFIREGDFGARLSETEWVFVYSHDSAGFNQRRVGMVSEKLWDFQLRHMGMSTVNFKWGAVDVQSEPLQSALEAAQQRMNQTRQTRRLPGMDPSVRLVVNG